MKYIVYSAQGIPVATTWNENEADYLAMAYGGYYTTGRLSPSERRI